MLAILLKALSDSLLSALFDFIKSEMRDRGLIDQGRAAQHTDDLEATVKEARDAAQTEEAVAGLDDAALDAGLERVRDSAATGHP